MKVIRTQLTECWTPIANAALQDHRISWRAKGLLAELLSYPDGWKTSIDKLVAQAKRAGGTTEGRDAMLRAVAELESAGYVAYQRATDDRGRWSTVLTVADDPKQLVDLKNRRSNRHTEKPNVGKPEGRSSGVSVDRESEDQGVTRKKNNKKITKNNEQEASSLRPGAQERQRQNPTQLILDQTNATPAEAEALIERLRNDPKVHTVAGFVQHLADEGDLQRRIDQIRGDRRTVDRQHRDKLRQIFRVAVMNQPPCPHGFGGGHLALDGFILCAHVRQAGAPDSRDIRDAPAALAAYLGELEGRGLNTDAEQMLRSLTDAQLDALPDVEMARRE